MKNPGGGIAEHHTLVKKYNGERALTPLKYNGERALTPAIQCQIRPAITVPEFTERGFAEFISSFLLLQDF